MLAALRRNKPSAQTVDVLIAAAIFLATVYPAARFQPSWSNALWVSLSSAPLIWRRRWPVPVAAVCGIGTTALSLVDALPDMPYGQLVATYTVAELSGLFMRLVTIGVSTAGIVISLVLPGEGYEAWGYTALVFVAAWALGTGMRARRSRIGLLEERTHRLAEEQLAAASLERARIARDMHDVLAHSVSMMVLQAEGGASIVKINPDRAVAAFEAISETGREALVQLRHTLGVLRDHDQEDSPATPLGLESLGGLLVRARNAGLDANLVEQGTPGRPPTEVGVTVYRLVQEALTNVVKHAGARKVDVLLDWSPARLEVSVTDDGRGRTNGAFPAGGHGLTGMRERVDACGGALAVGRGPGEQGFRVSATLPMTR